jgi:hypothetical protein
MQETTRPVWRFLGERKYREASKQLCWFRHLS